MTDNPSPGEDMLAEERKAYREGRYNGDRGQIEHRLRRDEAREEARIYGEDRNY